MKENGKQKSPEVLCMNTFIRSFPGHCILRQSKDSGEPKESLQGWSWVSKGKHAWSPGKVGWALGKREALKTMFLILGIALD